MQNSMKEILTDVFFRRFVSLPPSSSLSSLSYRYRHSAYNSCYHHYPTDTITQHTTAAIITILQILSLSIQQLLSSLSYTYRHSAYNSCCHHYPTDTVTQHTTAAIITILQIPSYSIQQLLSSLSYRYHHTAYLLSSSALVERHYKNCKQT